MKRSANQQEPLELSPHHKKACIINISEQTIPLFSSDVIGLIFSFLPFDEIKRNCLQLVNHQWNDSLLYDFRFEFLYELENYLSNLFTSDKQEEKNNQSENMMKLFVTVKHWLYSRQYLLERLDSYNMDMKKWFQWMLDMNNSNVYPKLEITKLELLFENMEQFQVLKVQLNEKSSMKLTIFYSSFEDTIIYVDVLSGVNDFEWNKLNIDPNVKRNLVLHVNAVDFVDPETCVEEYQINQEFFDSLFEMLKFPITQIDHRGEYEEITPFNVPLWTDFNFQERDATPIENVEFERDLEIHDERANHLINLFDLTRIKEVQVLELAWKVACRAFTTSDELKCQKTENVSVSNVMGRFVSVHFYGISRLCTYLTFTITFKNIKTKARFLVEQYKDSYDTYQELKIDSQDPIFDIIKNSHGFKFGDVEGRGLVDKDVAEMYRQLIEIAPHYNIPNSSSKSLIGNRKELMEGFGIE